ncbi:MAG: hypothetical protein ACTSPI_13860, partial [Candidatus Heimdallarchaeaceae archaeon]
CYGVYGYAGDCYGIYGWAVYRRGVYGQAGCCYGIYGCTGDCYGVYGHADCYGVCGNITSTRPVSGNGSYYDSTSSKNLKMSLEPVCVSECFLKNPISIYKWQWEDSNQRGFDRFIAPFTEDIKRIFELTDEDTGYYSLDGIALKLGIELLQDVRILKMKVKKLEKKLEEEINGT